ncbi:Syntaxin-8 [Homalodisca vitripennis]|nr:Syntaxin-8 [Homalodisca vitripennis]
MGHIWSSKHASCEAQHRFIVELLNTRSYEPRTSNKYDLLSAKARYQLKELENNARILKEMLEEEQSLTIEEKERRYRLIEDLESYVIQLTQKINSRSGEEERKSLMATGGRSVLGDMGTTGWASDDDDDAASQPLLQETNEQIKQQHQLLLKGKSSKSMDGSIVMAHAETLTSLIVSSGVMRRHLEVMPRGITKTFVIDSSEIHIGCVQMWLQQDGDSSHYTIAVHNTVNEQFPDKWIGWGVTVGYLACSPDLTYLDFYL